jgi:hypothetical protein
MAINSDAYNKQQLNVIVKVIGAMDDEAIDQSKKTSNALVEHLQKKIIDASGQTQNLIDDPIAKGSVVSRSKKATIGELNLGFAAQNTVAVEQRRNYGAGLNLDQINSGNFHPGQDNLARVHGAGLFIRHYARNSLIFWINGKMHLIRLLRNGKWQLNPAPLNYQSLLKQSN